MKKRGSGRTKDPLTKSIRGRPPIWMAKLKQLSNRMRKEGYQDQYIKTIESRVSKAFKEWGNKDPIEVDEDDVRRIMKLWGGLPNTQSHYRYCLARYLGYCKNYVIREIRWPYAKDIRYHVRWLSKDQIETLLNTDYDIRERMIIHLGLYMGLRICEIRRLKIKNVQITQENSYVDVHGKGNKYRTVPISSSTQKVFGEWFPERLILLNGRESEYLIIGPKSENLTLTHSYNILVKMRDRAGFHWTYHDLRRTFGRYAWLDGLPIETISEIFGHHDTSTTKRYIGVNYSDMSKAIDRVGDIFDSGGSA